MNTTNTPEHAYAGFWKRVAISASEQAITNILSGIALLVSLPMINWSKIITTLGTTNPFQAMVTMLTTMSVIFVPGIILMVVNFYLYFWKGRTIGDYIMHAKLVDAKTGLKPSVGKLIGRSFAKILSLLGLGLGFMWAGWDREKRAWHDSLSGIRYVETKSYSGGITWLANIGFLIIFPMLNSQLLESQIEKRLTPVMQELENSVQLQNGEFESLIEGESDEKQNEFPVLELQDALSTPSGETTQSSESVPLLDIPENNTPVQNNAEVGEFPTLELE